MQPSIDVLGISLKTFGIFFALNFVAWGLLLARRLREIGKPVDWAYEIARDYAERYEGSHGTGLVPKSAPLLQDIVDFWMGELGIDAEALNAAARPADLTLFLEVDPRTAARRRHGRGGAHELFDADEVQRAVARAYGRVARKHARTQRVVRVDGRGAADEVAGEILSRVRAVLPRRRRK